MVRFIFVSQLEITICDLKDSLKVSKEKYNLRESTGSLFPTFQIPKWEGWRWSVFSPGGILEYEQERV